MVRLDPRGSLLWVGVRGAQSVRAERRYPPWEKATSRRASGVWNPLVPIKQAKCSCKQDTARQNNAPIPKSARRTNLTISPTPLRPYPPVPDSGRPALTVRGTRHKRAMPRHLRCLGRGTGWGPRGASGLRPGSGGRGCRTFRLYFKCAGAGYGYLLVSCLKVKQ